jgi:hypothetical protein
MDSKEVVKANVGFIEHMTKMDDEHKSLLMNTIQYALLCIVPILGLQCIIETVFPNFEDSKGNFELAVEIIGQMVFTLIALFFIHRLICFVPTYSKEPLSSINFLTVSIIYVLVTVYNKNDNLGKKMESLAKKCKNLWNGEEEEYAKQPENGGGSVSISRPITGLPPAVPTHQASRADYVNTQANVTPPLLPVSSTSQDTYNQPQQQQQQQEAFAPMSEPMAANGVLGGGFGSSW